MISRCALAAALFATFASAEEKQNDPFLIRSSITVTGTRTETEVHQSPVSTSVLTHEELATRNAPTLDQGLSLMEGIYSLRLKGSQDTLAGIGMRGFDGRGANQERTLILLDGQPLNDAYTGGVLWATLPVTEVDRVEVARGPFSSLYGGNAMGGVVNILTRPADHREFELAGQYGTYNAAEYSLRYSDRLWKRMGVTVSYQRQQYGGYATNGVFATAATVASTGAPLISAPAFTPTTTGGARYIVGQQGENWYNQHAFRSKLDYTFTQNTTASVQYIRRRYGYGYDAGASFINDATGQPVQSGTFYFNDGSPRRFSLSPASFMGGPGAGVSQIANLQLFHSFSPRQIVRLTGGVQDIPYDYYLTPSASALPSSGTGQTAERPSRAWSADAQWNWTASSRQDIVFGAEVRHDQSAISEYDLSNWALRDSRIRLATYGCGKSFTQAEYGQYRLSVTGRLKLTAGGRVDYWKGYDGTSMAAYNAAPVIYPERAVASLSAKLAAVYDLGAGWSLRGSGGTAFRNPTVYELYRSWRSSSGTTYLSNPLLEPERLRSWELGMRKSLGHALEADAAYYENGIHNLVYRSTDLVIDPSGATSRYFNAGRGRTRGAEFGLRQRPASWLLVRQTYTLTDARVVENVYAPATEGRQVPNVPRNVASASVVVARHGWSGSINGQYFGRFFSNDLNTDKIKGVYGAYDPFFLADANVSYRFERFATVSVSVQNLLDRRYFEYYLAPGRAVSIGLRFHL